MSLQGSHIIAAADKGKGYIIEVVGKGEGKVRFILLGEGTEMLQRDLRQVHSFSGQQGSFLQHPAMDVPALDTLHNQAYQAIVDENSLTDEYLFVQVRIVDADTPAVSHADFGGDDQLLVLLQGIGGILQPTQSNFRPLQVHEDCDGETQLLAGFAYVVVTLLLLLVRAVAEIQPYDPATRLKDGLDHLIALAGRTEWCDNLGIVHSIPPKAIIMDVPVFVKQVLPIG